MNGCHGERGRIRGRGSGRRVAVFNGCQEGLIYPVTAKVRRKGMEVSLADLR